LPHEAARGGNRDLRSGAQRVRPSTVNGYVRSAMVAAEILRRDLLRVPRGHDPTDARDTTAVAVQARKEAGPAGPASSTL